MTRNLGLLILGPIMVNIIAFHVFIMHGQTLLDPMVIFVAAATLFLMWTERTAFYRLIHR